jgi:hypothetical protein
MTTEERFDRIENAIEKQNAGIRDLIVVSRTVLTSIKETNEAHLKVYDRLDAEIDKLREAQAETEEKLNILVETVDRIIRHRNEQRE